MAVWQVREEKYCHSALRVVWCSAEMPKNGGNTAADLEKAYAFTPGMKRTYAERENKNSRKFIKGEVKDYGKD